MPRLTYGRVSLEPYDVSMRDKLLYIADNMREIDKEECWLMAETNPMESLEQSLGNSDQGYIATYGDEPCCAYGVSTRSKVLKSGIVWLLGTDVLTEHPMTFLRWSRRVIPELIKKYSMVYNYVSEKNTASKRWLEFNGFKVEDVTSIKGYLFILYERRNLRCAWR